MIVFFFWFWFRACISYARNNIEAQARDILHSLLTSALHQLTTAPSSSLDGIHRNYHNKHKLRWAYEIPSKKFQPSEADAISCAGDIVLVSDCPTAVMESNPPGSFFELFNVEMKAAGEVGLMPSSVKPADLKVPTGTPTSSSNTTQPTSGPIEDCPKVLFQWAMGVLAACSHVEDSKGTDYFKKPVLVFGLIKGSHLHVQPL